MLYLDHIWKSLFIFFNLFLASKRANGKSVGIIYPIICEWRNKIFSLPLIMLELYNWSSLNSIGTILAISFFYLYSFLLSTPLSLHFIRCFPFWIILYVLVLFFTHYHFCSFFNCSCTFLLINYNFLDEVKFKLVNKQNVLWLTR